MGDAKATADLDAVDVGQPQIQDHERDAVVDCAQGGLTFAERDNRVSLRLEHADEARGDRLIVLDEHDLRSHAAERTGRPHSDGDL